MVFDLRTTLNTFAVLVCIFAMWKGGRAERWAGMAVLLNVVIGQTAHYVAPELMSSVRLFNDGLTALLLLGVTLLYGAVWMGVVMLFYAVQFSMHSFYLVTAKPTDNVAILTNNVVYFGIVGSLIAGTVVAWRRRLRAITKARQSQTAQTTAT